MTIAAGNLAAQFIPFLVLPFLQKYFFDPAAFGLLTLYVSISELLIGIAGMKYEYAVVAAKRLKDAVNLVALTLFITLGVTLLTLLGSGIFYVFFPGLETVSRLRWMIFLLPVSVFAAGVYTVINFRLNRQALFGHMAGVKVANTFSAESVKLLTGYTKAPGGLVTGRAAGHVAAMLYSVVLYVSVFRREWRLFSFPHMKKMIGRYREYPLFAMPSALVGTLITFVYLQFFLHYFGQDKVGLLGVSVSYIGVALGIISTSFGEVFFRNISTITSIAELRRKYIRFARLLFVPAALLCVALHAIPVSWVTYFLGDKWADMLPITRVMALWMSISFVSTSLSFIYLRLNLQRLMFFVDVVHLLAVAVAIPLAYSLTGTFIGALYGFAIVQIIHYLVAILIAERFMNSQIKR